MQHASARSWRPQVIRRVAHFNLKAPFTMLPLAAALCAIAYAPSAARAQLATCQTPAPPFKIPAFTDTAIGWPLTGSQSDPHNQFVVGDIDGDGNDELITILNGDIRAWRWIGTGWSSAGKITNAAIAAVFGDSQIAFDNSVISAGGGSTDTNFWGPVSVRLADVDGDGQNELVIYVNNGYDNVIYSLTSGQFEFEIEDREDRELIYKYDKTSSTFTLLTSDLANYKKDSTHTYGLGPSSWIKAHNTDTKYTRVRLNSFTGNIDAAQFANGSWTAVSAASRPTDLNPTACDHTGGDCVAYTDLNGDGNTDMVYLGNDGKTHILPSTAQKLFGGTPITSKIPAAPAAGNPSQVAIATTLGWMMGDLDGDGKDELIFPAVAPITSDPVITAYYWDATANDFAAVVDPGSALVNVLQAATINFASMAVARTLIQLPNNGLGPVRGIVAIGGGATVVLPFSNQGGQVTFGIPAGFGYDVPLDGTISVNGGLGGTYSEFFRLPVEGGSLLLLTRSSSGLINHVPTPRPYETGNFFVEPLTLPELSDRGYPPYTVSQQLAYQYISTAATGNPDIRSLYPDPAVPWAPYQYKLETMAAPPASAGISATDFAFVQKQTDYELTALQATNAFYGITGQILTNTYLVKDAALSETTDLLGLPSEPDVTGQILNEVTTALNGLGTVLSFASSILPLTKDAVELATITARLSAAYNVSDMLGLITGDISTYTTGSAPDLATGTYNLKKSLDDDSFAATTSNTCHQAAALSDWSQSKYIADGIINGDLPLDLETQQAFTVAGQALFRLNVWQALAPTKWSTVTVQKFSTACSNCLFAGNSNYPVTDSIQVTAASCKLLPDNSVVSLLLEDPSTSNYPNLIALNALFSAPPDGLGANPVDVFMGNYNWNFPYQGIDVKFLTNTGYTTFNCSNWKLLSPQVTPNTRMPGELILFDSARLFHTGDHSANARIESLIEDVKSKITDARWRDVFVMTLDAANSRLGEARTHNQPPTEALRLLSDFIERSHWHSTVNFKDAITSRDETIEAVAIRDFLIDATAAFARAAR